MRQLVTPPVCVLKKPLRRCWYVAVFRATLSAAAVVVAAAAAADDDAGDLHPPAVCLSDELSLCRRRNQKSRTQCYVCLLNNTSRYVTGTVLKMRKIV